MGTLTLEGTTARILETVERRPGLRVTDLAQRVGVHPSTADYHLHKLVKKGQIARERVGRQVHHYPVGTGWCPRARRIHACTTETARRALQIAVTKGVISRRALTTGGASRSAARWAIKVLEEAGALEKMAWGVYVLVDGIEACARAALHGRPCQGCNPALR